MANAVDIDVRTRTPLPPSKIQIDASRQPSKRQEKGLRPKSKLRQAFMAVATRRTCPPAFSLQGVRSACCARAVRKLFAICRSRARGAHAPVAPNARRRALQNPDRRLSARFVSTRLPHSRRAWCEQRGHPCKWLAIHSKQRAHAPIRSNAAVRSGSAPAARCAARAAPLALLCSNSGAVPNIRHAAAAKDPHLSSKAAWTSPMHRCDNHTSIDTQKCVGMHARTNRRRHTIKSREREREQYANT